MTILTCRRLESFSDQTTGLPVPCGDSGVHLVHQTLEGRAGRRQAVLDFEPCRPIPNPAEEVDDAGTCL